VIPVSEVLAESSDVGAIKIALMTGEDRMYKYIRNFGLGQETGIELPGETRGMAKPLSRWSKVSIGAIAMGQEIGISAVQLAQMISSIGNDGILVPPRIVAGEIHAAATPQAVAFHPAEGRRVLSPRAAALMRQMMQGVVLHGTGKKAILEGYSSGGKTGTAQKFDPAKHAYSHTKYWASFAGLAPINNPTLTVVVILDSPEGRTTLEREGGWVAAPVFHRVAQQALEYLHAPHDLEIPANRQVLLAREKASEKDLGEGSPDHPGEEIDVEDAATPEVSAPPEVEMGAGRPVASDDGGRYSRHPTSRNEIIPTALHEDISQPMQTSTAVVTPAAVPMPSSTPIHGTVVLDVEQGGIAVPSFLGKSVRSAIEIAEANGLDLEIVGSGIAQDQSPVVGTHVPSGAKITVRFGR
jgi:cell division protein FtsI (penicillin-binding protein 3)